MSPGEELQNIKERRKKGIVKIIIIWLYLDWVAYFLKYGLSQRTKTVRFSNSFGTNSTVLLNPLEIKEAIESMNIREKNFIFVGNISSLSSFEKENKSNSGLRLLFDVLKINTILISTFMKLYRDYEEEDVQKDEFRYLSEKT